MKFYLYSHKNAMYDYLSRNLIASYSVVEDRQQYRSMSTQLDDFLFVTHICYKKCARQIDTKAFASVPAVVFEIACDREEKTQVLLLRRQNDQIFYEYGTWSDYDCARHIGALLLTEIPLSCVEHIYFETQEDMEEMRPSEDYWFPREKFALIEERAFPCIETYSLDQGKAEVALPKDVSIKDLNRAVREREKDRAALLYMVMGTQAFETEHYNVNIDAYLADLFEIDKDKLIKQNKDFKEVFAEEKDNLDLTAKTPAQTVNQRMYNCTYRFFQNVPVEERIFAKVSADYFAYMQETLQEGNDEDDTLITLYKVMSTYLWDDMSKTIGDLLNVIPKHLPALRAVAFVLRAAGSLDTLQKSFEAYHLDSVSRRCALALYGALRGLGSCPGKPYKDNAVLWSAIEEMSLKGARGPLSLKAKTKEAEEKTFFNIIPVCDKTVSFEDVYQFVTEHKEDLSEMDQKKILTAVKKILGKKDMEERYSEIVCTCDLPGIKKGMRVTEEELKERIRLLEAQMTQKTLAIEVIYNDWVEKKENFEKIYKNSEAYWKKRVTKEKKA